MQDEQARGRVPYALLLVKAAGDWARAHAGALPATYAEKQAFKEGLRGWNRDIEGVPIEVCCCVCGGREMCMAVISMPK
jgi:hypothetical protein